MFKLQNCSMSCSLALKEALAGMEDFRGVNNDTFDSIISISHMLEYEKDSVIYYENDPVDSLHYLLHGCVKVYKINKFDNEVILNLYASCCIDVNNPPLINYYALINKYAQSNVLCLENCRILSINSAAFKEILKSDQKLSFNMLGRANKVIEDQVCIIHNNMIYDAKAKLASLLSKTPHIFTIVNKKIVAQMLNISQETLSRSIQKLKEEKVIAVDGNKHIVITNQNKLNSLF